MGWIFGASSWWIDVKLGNWVVYPGAFARVFTSLLRGGGALAGLVIAWVYNFVANTMGGLKIDLATLTISGKQKRKNGYTNRIPVSTLKAGRCDKS
jgi:hypothetical protein